MSPPPPTNSMTNDTQVAETYIPGVLPISSFHPGQWSAFTSKSRVTVVTAGQGGGKTSLGMWRLYATMQAFPSESHLIGFPDYGLLNRVILNKPDPDRPTLIEFLRAMGEEPQLHIQDRWIQCKSGQIFFGSGSDLVGWEGAHCKSAWIDEFDECPVEVYRRALERTRMRHGYVLLTGTPRKVRWVKKELEPRVKAGDEDFVTIIRFPSTANPKYDQKAMDEAKLTMPAWEYRRMHLGEWADMEGGNLYHRDWWRVIPNFPPDSEYLTIIQAYDTAFKVKTKDDYSVCETWARAKKGLYLLDVSRKKLEYPDLLQHAKELYQQYRPSRVLVEDKASGQSLVQDLRRLLIPVIPIQADKDKYTRASGVTGLVQAGFCHLPESAPWLHDFIEEHAEFPEGEHDDQVDATSIALAYLKSSGIVASGGRIQGGKKSSSWRDS